jgi:SAM-dependent methyltransferase
MDVSKIYSRRFTPNLEFRRQMWKVLCSDFFQIRIQENSRVLEIAAGYCEFINHIHASQKFAVDINPETKNYAADDVTVVLSPSDNIPTLPDESIDVIFVSNFFEHITREAILATIQEAKRLLTSGGKFIIMQPNIRFCAQDYWMFFDHITPVDDRALVEALEISGFRILENIPRFMPYTTQSSLPKSLWMIRLYLKMPFVWKFFGQQALITCTKE